MNDAPRVSIVVPVRHAAKTILGTLESVLAQTSDWPFEVIVAVAEGDASAQAFAGLEHPSLRVLVAPGRTCE